MNTQFLIRSAITGLVTNKSRSLLTILGIVIGITSIILMVSIGTSAEELIIGEISGLGAETVVVRPGREPTGPTDLSDTLFADSLKKSDLAALMKKSNAPNIASIAPMLAVPGVVSSGGETFRRPTTLGTSAEFITDAFDIFPAQGDIFDETDIRARASVAIIGIDVRDELFGLSDPIGKFITIKGRKFRVIGVFPDKGRVAFLNFNEVVVIPYTTAQTYLLGIDHFHELIVKADSPETVGQTVRDIEVTLRALHKITDPEKDDFYVETQQGLVEQIRKIIGVLTLFLSSVVAIALVVAGVGVMNIMIVSVTERTREIGLRKALGATRRDILLQFLFEAIVLTGIGGVVGIALGALLAFSVSVVLNIYAGLDTEFAFPFSAAILGLAVSVLVGIVFGLYPARQAAKKSPIEALRYE
jgi:putative ABC transport system permease protein